ncbi:hypothetical protein BMR02_09850 [Methylococcaceae bacterium HT1]|nr:hypothetical protein BMR10_05500 [Methylococcaceae bacterium CS4]TXK97744.1 hypothetical protein BMR02_09850 [Methylococcaceae bacterium HT1]TXK97920.1 hypothetical protein BMR11_09430 [Methylococcaceae bacterium CS5]TXL08652.1 hypothetical protein BMR07_02020 [Methylococcaceae bacterium CS1]TXL08706.1 hypothetical protein BMR09_02455 [Methylococcaceae bacterium CS3]TXL12294.1 hypothetical protein BMR08_00505 [Methylococcaceae bacterium CS2]TXL15788.1 hypothetical protein BMR04_11085 [Meth
MRIPEELKTSLKEMSALSHRSQSQIAIKAIAEYVNRNEWKMKAIQEAKKQADKGEFISHAATETWLDSWGEENELTIPEVDIFIK